jgi:preprotein translocase subunit SecB
VEQADFIRMSALSPLQLKNSLFTDVRITSQHLTETEMQGGMETAVEFRTQVDPNNKRLWQIIVRVHMRGSGNVKAPCVGTVECVGAFEVVPEWPEDKIEQLVAVNGTGLLYSSIRDMVCNITSRGPWGMIMLPTQSFVDTYEAGKKAKAASAVPAAVT